MSITTPHVLRTTTSDGIQLVYISRSHAYRVPADSHNDAAKRTPLVWPTQPNGAFGLTGSEAIVACEAFHDGEHGADARPGSGVVVLCVLSTGTVVVVAETREAAMVLPIPLDSKFQRPHLCYKHKPTVKSFYDTERPIPTRASIAHLQSESSLALVAVVGTSRLVVMRIDKVTWKVTYKYLHDFKAMSCVDVDARRLPGTTHVDVAALEAGGCAVSVFVLPLPATDETKPLYASGAVRLRSMSGGGPDGASDVLYRRVFWQSGGGAQFGGGSLSVAGTCRSAVTDAAGAYNGSATAAFVATMHETTRDDLANRFYSIAFAKPTYAVVRTTSAHEQVVYARDGLVICSGTEGGTFAAAMDAETLVPRRRLRKRVDYTTGVIVFHPDEGRRFFMPAKQEDAHGIDMVLVM